MILRPRWSSTSSQHRAQEPSKTLLERGCWPKPFSEAFLNVFGGSRNPENHAPATVRAQFWLKSLIAPGAPKSSPKGSQNRGQKPPWRLQDGFKTRLKKGFDFSANFKALFADFGGPRGAGGASKWPPESLQKRPWLQSYVFPPPEALQEPILTPSGLDFGASGS